MTAASHNGASSHLNAIMAFERSTQPAGARRTRARTGSLERQATVCEGAASKLELKVLEHQLTVCKVATIQDIDLSCDFYFIGKTDEELSLVCKTEDVPAQTLERNDGWRGFRIQGVLDFSLIGILSRLSSILAENGIGIFAVSTYNTDYILVKEENFGRALDVLQSEGYSVVGNLEHERRQSR